MPQPAATSSSSTLSLSKTGAEMNASGGASGGSAYNGDDPHRSPDDYEAAMQQQRQFYQLTQPNAGHQHYDVLTTQQATTTSLVTTAASGAVAATTHTALIETSLATFNGNSHFNAVKGGGTPPYGIPGGGSVGNGNNHSHSNSNSSSSNNINNNMGNNNKATPSPAGGGGGDAISLVSALKKSAMPPPQPPMHANSREDVASLGGTSSVYSQQSATNNAAPPNVMSNNDTSSLPQYNAGYGNASNGTTGLGGPFTANEKNENNNNPGIPFGNAPPAVESSYCHRENEDPGDGLGPLPPKWETAYTERGELYFIDHNTGTSHWLDPRLSKFQKKSLEDCGDDELPYGWEKIEDSLYGTYFIDHVNRRTQYENPVLEAKRRAAEQKQEQQQLQQQHHQLQNLNSGQMPRSQASSGHPNEDSGHDGERNGLDNDSLMGSGGRPGGSGMNPLPPPPVLSYGAPPSMGGVPLLPYKFTRNPAEMQGERITTTLVKSARGLGITIVGGDDSAEEFLQIKSVVPNGPAWLDGRLRTGDILVYINDTCVLGFTHHEMVNIFQSILPGDSVTLEVCRGYPLPFDPNDPNTEVVTTIAVDGMTMSSLDPGKSRRYDMGMNMDGNYNYADLSSGPGGSGAKGGPINGALSGGDITNSEFILKKKMDVATHTVAINKGTMGFGFTISDSVDGQTVKKIIDRNCCPQLQEDDVLLEINEVNVKNKTHQEVVQILKECSNTEATVVKIQRGVAAAPAGSLMQSGSGNVAKLRKNFITGKGLFRSKTPTADLYSTQQKEVLPIRPKTPLVDTRRARVKTPNNELNQECDGAMGQGTADSMGLNLGESRTDNKSTNSLLEIEAINKEIPFMDPYPKLVTSLSERLAGASLMGSDLMGGAGRKYEAYQQQEYATAGAHNNYLSPDCNPIYGLAHNPDLGQHMPSVGNGPAGRIFPGGPPLSLMSPSQQQQHHENCQCYECQDYQAHKIRQQQQTLMYGMPPQGGASGSPLMTMGGMSGQYSPAASSGMHLGPNERSEKRINELLNDRRRVGFTPLDSHSLYNLGGPGVYKPQMMPQQQQQQQQQLSFQPNHSHINWAGVPQNGSILRNGHMDLMPSDEAASDQYELTEVTLERQALGFGFRIVGGTEEGSQVTVGHIVPGGAADNDHRITTGDEILSIDGINVVHASHHKVVSLMGEAALRGQVTMILRRRVNGPGGGGAGGGGSQLTPQMPQSILRSPVVRYPYDVIVSRHENEGFGFVIISSSNQYYGSTIGKLIPGSPADRCNELKVGDRITAVNRIDIAGMSHGDVVNLIKDSGLHVRLTIGCPKEGAAMGGPHLNNSKQISPGQLSQIPSMGYHTPLLQQQQQQSPQPLAGTPTLQPPQQL